MSRTTTPPDHLALIRAQRDRIKALEAELSLELGKLGVMVAAARTDQVSPEVIGAELGWHREKVRRVATEHGWQHRWGRDPDVNVPPEEFRERVTKAAREWFGAGNRSLRLRDLAPVATAAGRSESWLSKVLKQMAEDGLLAPAAGRSGYRAGPKLAPAKATRRRTGTKAAA